MTKSLTVIICLSSCLWSCFDDTFPSVYHEPVYVSSDYITEASKSMIGTWSFASLEISERDTASTRVMTINDCETGELGTYFNTIYFNNFRSAINFVFPAKSHTVQLLSTCGAGSALDMGTWTLRQVGDTNLFLSFKNSSSLFLFTLSDITDSQIRMEDVSSLTKSSPYRLVYLFDLKK